MQIFCEVKRNKPDLEGQGYTKWVKHLNFLFCCGKYQNLQYHEYVMKRQRDCDKYIVQSYRLKLPALIVLLMMSTYRSIFDATYSVPTHYLPSLLMLECQVWVLTFCKIITLAPAFAIFRLIKLCRK